MSETVSGYRPMDDAPSGEDDYFLVRPRGTWQGNGKPYLPTVVHQRDGELFKPENDIKPMVWTKGLRDDMRDGPTTKVAEANLEGRPLPDTENGAAILAFLKTDQVYDILSYMCFELRATAALFRATGDGIKRKAEDEQAHMMRWMLTLAAEHGAQWTAAAGAEVARRRALLPKADEAAPATAEASS